MEIAADVRALLNCLDAPAILLGRDYRILLANSAYEAIYGDGVTLRRRHCYEVSHGITVPCDLAGEHCPLKQCLQTKQNARVLHVHHTPRGQEYVNVETWPVKDENDEILYFVEILRPSTIATTRGGSGLVGKSPSFRRTLELIDRVAASDTTVLLLGETGTGKEVMARTLHERSARNTGPFVPVECTGLPDSLFESELFGYVKGAFTGAHADKPGLVESAAGGTLFLDEVGDVPLSEQVKLLRLLETRRFRRVGSTEPQSADFRLVCATNSNLYRMVRESRFREDLYYRLSVFEVALPALRERLEDLPLLVDSLLDRLESQLSLSPQALAVLEGYPFPGNIRELRNIVERAALMCDGDTILPGHLSLRSHGHAGMVAPGTLADGSPVRTGVPGFDARGRADAGGGDIQTLQSVETDYLRHALRLHTGDRRSLALKLGISERALYRKLSALKEAEEE